jgi:hypothetical protein
MFADRMPRFSGMPLAAFALCVRSHRHGSQVSHVLFSRAYNYQLYELFERADGGRASRLDLLRRSISAIKLMQH